MSSESAREILVHGADALAHAGRGEASVEILRVIAEQLEVESAVIVIINGRDDRLAIVASHGLGEAAASALAEAIQNPGHPIARTVANPVASFNVPPTAPGGPALRSHLPLTVTRDGTKTVLGVLALAHQRPFAASDRPLLEAAVDLAAVAIERHRQDVVGG